MFVRGRRKVAIKFLARRNSQFAIPPAVRSSNVELENYSEFGELYHFARISQAVLREPNSYKDSIRIAFHAGTIQMARIYKNIYPKRRRNRIPMGRLKITCFLLSTECSRIFSR